jgi:hypothetical protein
MIPAVNIPHYWIRPQQILPSKAGHQRFMWDLHYDPLQVPASYPIAAVYQNTEPAATAPWAMPGNYTVRLTVDGKTTTQPLVLKMDPRVKTSLKDLQLQHTLSVDCYEARRSAQYKLGLIADLRTQVADRLTKAEGPAVAALKQYDEQLAALTVAPPQAKEKGLEQLSGSFATLFNLLHDSDWPPTVSMINTAEMLKMQFSITFMKWFVLKQAGLQSLNQQLKQQLMKELTLKDK